MRFALPIPLLPIGVDGFLRVVSPWFRDCLVRYKIPGLQLLRGELVRRGDFQSRDFLGSWVTFQRDLNRPVRGDLGFQ
eukprot:95963-Heterocapsa_arctica.AAC.1